MGSEARLFANLVVYALWFGALGLLLSAGGMRRLYAAGGRHVEFAIAVGLLIFAFRSVWRAAT